MTIKTTTQNHNLLLPNEREFNYEAHTGLSTKNVEQTRFEDIWDIGLYIFAKYAVRDNNEANWTQIKDPLKFMPEATSIPILLNRSTAYL